MRGFKDTLPPISYKFEYIRKIFEHMSVKFGVNLIELPIVEKADLYFRTSGKESEVCNKELFEVRKYQGDFENWVLRPEATASCARALNECNFLEHKKICRLGYYGPMFRYNRPQKGRYRQFIQAGWEWFGINDKYLDFELIMASCELLNQLNIEYVLEINSIGNFEDRTNYRKILKNYLKTEQDPFKLLDKLERFENIPEIELNSRDCDTLNFVKAKLDAVNINYKHNPYLVRGLDYYNGIVFEFKNENQTILAGGRYDGLMEQLGGKPTPAIGFALGVDRVVDILNYEQNYKNLALISINENDYAYSLIEKFRKKEYSVIPLWGIEFGKALKIASKNFKYVIIVGGNEKNKKSFILKNLEKSSQKELSFDFEDKDLGF